MCSSKLSNHLPALIVFDLDETLWPFAVGNNYDHPPPYRKVKGVVCDHLGRQIKPYPDVPDILRWLHKRNILMAAASRTETPDRAVALINLLGWADYLKLQEIYPEPKTTHLENLAKKTLLAFEQMLFFDNEEGNIRDVSKLGVVSHFLNSSNELTWTEMEKGLQCFAQKRFRKVN